MSSFPRSPANSCLAPFGAAPFGALWLVLAAAPVAAGGLDFDTWELRGELTTVEKYQGQEALRIATGGASQREVKLQDGTIELDMALNGHRSFVFVQFRVQAEGAHEEVYFRPHKSGLPDALQYTPVFEGEGNWQLYHGPGATAAAPLPADTWIHVKLVVEGRKAALFVGDAAEPQLVVPRLAREPAAGYIGVRGFIPQGSPAEHSVHFANVSVHPGRVDFDFSKVPSPAQAPAGVIRSWELSRPFVPSSDGAVTTLPAEISAGPWTAATTEPSGLVLLARQLERPEGSRRSAVLARVRFRSTQAATRRLDLGYSDEVSVHWNGRLLFYADDSYSYDQPRREGLIGLDQAALYLSFEAGENELVLVIADSFGGWGVMARLEDQAGVEILSSVP